MTQGHPHAQFDNPLHLHRCDASRNMARFYRLSIERDLFGAAVVLREWGRIGTRGHRSADRFSHESEAQAMFLRLARAKQRRGYIDAGP